MIHPFIRMDSKVKARIFETEESTRKICETCGKDGKAIIFRNDIKIQCPFHRAYCDAKTRLNKPIAVYQDVIRPLRYVLAYTDDGKTVFWRWSDEFIIKDSPAGTFDRLTLIEGDL